MDAEVEVEESDADEGGGKKDIDRRGNVISPNIAVMLLGCSLFLFVLEDEDVDIIDGIALFRGEIELRILLPLFFTVGVFMLRGRAKDRRTCPTSG